MLLRRADNSFPGFNTASQSACAFLSSEPTAIMKKTVDPSSLPPWKRAKPPGKSKPLTMAQIEAARERAAAARRRYPNLVDNMWAARHVPRGGVGKVSEEE